MQPLGALTLFCGEHRVVLFLVAKAAPAVKANTEGIFFFTNTNFTNYTNFPGATTHRQKKYSCYSQNICDDELCRQKNIRVIRKIFVTMSCVAKKYSCNS